MVTDLKKNNRHMIITEISSSRVVTSITAIPTRFQINASAHAFRTLSGFYSEPILAIPRELGANAWDAHVKAGNTDQMFEVHVPNNLEPWFMIRDFGTGISPEDMLTVYATYFKSTKGGDNTTDGCMGLGSKTPLNYTQNFTVTSFFNGKKYVYNCFIDEGGGPSIVPVAVEETTEHNGLEVKFGVKISDIGVWTDKITRAYESFRYRPIIKGANINYKPREYLYQGKGWGYRKNEGYHSTNVSYAFMGNYCYPISITAIRSAIYELPNYSPIYTMFNDGGFDFFFDIGDLEVAPNKEQLQYTDITTNLLTVTATRVLTELKELVFKNVEIPKTKWEALALFNKYNNSNSPHAKVRNITGNIPVMFNGEKVVSGNESVFHVHSSSGCLSPTEPMPRFQLHVIDAVTCKCKKTGTYYPQSIDKQLVVLYTNSENIKKSRVQHYLKTTYINANLPLPLCYVIIDTSLNNKTLLAHKKYFGWDDSIIKSVESLPKPPPVPRAKRTVNADDVFYLDISNAIPQKKLYMPSGWRRKHEVFDSAQTYYYVDFVYSDMMWKGRDIQSAINDIFNILITNKLNNGATVIYGINRTNANLLKVGKWINIVDLVDAYVKANIAIYEHQIYVKNYRHEIGMMSDLHRKITSSSTFISGLSNPKTRTLFTSFVSAYDSADASDENYHSDQFYSIFNVLPKKHGDGLFDLIKFEKLLSGKYMGIFDMIYHTDQSSELAKIINFIDEKS
jgi:hypothetical protein